MDNTHPTGTVDNPRLLNCTSAQREWFLALSCVVAGKQASIQQNKLVAFIRTLEQKLRIESNTAVEVSTLPACTNYPIFTRLLLLKNVEASLSSLLQIAKLGQYNRLNNTFSKILKCLKEDADFIANADRLTLIRLPGIGMKTASFFIMNTSDEDLDYACLDRHVLDWLTMLGYKNIPTNAPSSVPKYEAIEKIFLQECTKRNKKPTELDFEVWSSKRRKNEKVLTG